MRSHSEIIKEATVAKIKATLAGLGFEIARVTVQQWATRSSIPAPYWRAISNAGLATLDELATAAATEPDKIAS